MRIALGIEYQGTTFHGWQYQYNQLPTIQGALMQAISAVADHEVEIVAAGRTDAGVHAIGQVAHFDTIAMRTEKAWVFGINSHLPDSVAVKWAQAVSEDFHARFSAVSRHYRYYIYNARASSAIFSHHATWVCQPLDEQRMHDAAQVWIGEHDFSAFRAAECQAKSPIRRLQSIQVQRQGAWIMIDVSANAFLHHMVRNMAGVLIAIGRGQQPVSWAQTVLESCERRQAGVTAPPQGLYLVGVQYPPELNVPDISMFDPLRFIGL